MTIGTNRSPFTRFAVADVTPGTERLPGIAVTALLERNIRERILSLPRKNCEVVERGDFHGLISAAALAFKQHYPLVLSPDMIWLTILQGVAQHVRNHPETMRKRLIHHETKIELFVDRRLQKLPDNDSDMLQLVKAFVERISQHVPPEKHFLLKTDFSTTTDAERIAAAVALMDTFQPYFDYVFYCICGIPFVTLEGLPEDWELLSTKVRTLHESDLELCWWTQQLLSLCDQFVRAARGDVDRNHWSDLFKLTERYGTEGLNGWLLKFIPYVRKERNEPPRHRNPVLEPAQDSKSAGDSRFTITGCTSDMLPTGLAKAPVVCMNPLTGEKQDQSFIAGFIGVTQSPVDLSLRPEIGWAISEGAKIDRLISQLRRDHEIAPPAGLDLKTMVHRFNSYLPADLWRFYSETNGAFVRLAKINKWGDRSCRILPLKGVLTSAGDPLWERESILRELSFLHRQGRISADELADRQAFYRDYSNLARLATVQDGDRCIHYVFGTDPESISYSTMKAVESRGEIFRWNGDPVRGAFIPVAHTFADWLEVLLKEVEFHQRPHPSRPKRSKQ